MEKQILISVDIGETKVAIMEEGSLMEYSIEHSEEQRQAGNIYRGRVANVLPGMQAAFIDIGEEKNAFIYKDDLFVKDKEYEKNNELKKLPIQQLLHEGQEVFVQMIKEPMGSKGARVTTQITIPGRYLVLMPTADYVGVSRRIENEAERERLKEVVTKFKAPEMGVIIRTAAEEIEQAELQSDYEFLIGVWKKIQKRMKKGPCPALLYRDHDLLYRIIRDYLSRDISRVLIDDQESYQKAIELLKTLAPSLKSRVDLYQGPPHLFTLYNIGSQLEKALKRKVWLDSGAYLIIDQTEALTVIDVNTGKFIGTTSLEETVFQTNLMAAREISRQIKLRNLAGIIIIDFIDMASDEERTKVIEAFEQELNRDRIKSNILGFTALGLLEMTRKKVKQSLREILQVECHTCDGTGYQLSLDTYTSNAIKRIRELVKDEPEEAVLIGLNSQIASLLIGPGGSKLEKLERALQKAIFIKGQEELIFDQVHLLKNGTKEAVEAYFLPVQEGAEIEVMISEPHITNAGDGIARLGGYIINVEKAASLIGKTVKILVTKVSKTYAKAKII